MSHGDISRELHIPRQTISGFLQRLDQRGSAENLPRAGDHEQHLQAKISTFDTAEANTPIPELRDITNSEVSISIIRDDSKMTIYGNGRLRSELY